jgi:hypothetical protein
MGKASGYPPVQGPGVSSSVREHHECYRGARVCAALAAQATNETTAAERRARGIDRATARSRCGQAALGANRLLGVGAAMRPTRPHFTYEHAQGSTVLRLEVWRVAGSGPRRYRVEVGRLKRRRDSRPRWLRLTEPPREPRYDKVVGFRGADLTTFARLFERLRSAVPDLVHATGGPAARATSRLAGVTRGGQSRCES